MPGIFSRPGEGRTKDAHVARSLLVGAVVVLGLLGPFAACRHREGDPVHNTIDDLARAASDRDAKAVLKLLSPDFTAADGTHRAEIEGVVRQYFAAYENLDVDIRDYSVERSEGAALVRFRADLTGRPAKIGGLEGLVPSSSSWRFEVRLAPQDGTWRIAWANWSEAGAGR